MGVAKYRLTKTNDGGFQFSLYGASGRIIATSETYRSKTAATNAIESVRKAAPGAVVEDQTPGRASSPNTPQPVAKAARTAGRAAGKVRAVIQEVLEPDKNKPTGLSNGRATSGATKRPATRTTAAKPAPAKKAAAKKSPAKTPAKKAPVAKKTAAKKAPVAKKTAAKKQAPAKKAPVTKKAPAKKQARR